MAKSDTPISLKEKINWLKALNFVPDEGKVNIYSKHYDNYTITADIDNNKIDYPEPIVIHDRATSNFNKKENLVVLECIDRLLTKGYKPECIELERIWKLGKKYKGRLDILVKYKNDSFLMIECKTWGKEYNKEKSNMYEDGGQLISYFTQSRITKYLCLYSSTLSGEKIEYVNDIINITSDFSNCSDAEAVFEKWDKNFNTKGLFDDDILPYKLEFKGLLYDDLKDLEDDSSSLIYNQFAEILRRNVVSDKSNAFNKIFNLFICKIVDEDAKNSTTEETDFQWKADDTNELLFDRLNSLYKKGAKDYINIDVEDLNNSELDNLLRASSNNDKIKKAFIKLRLYKNNEFAFKEVYNEDTFLENARIVKEVVQLLQSFRLKYNQKQQFLGNFFELLLNSGFKQEVGQYFTPLPLARFICKSLPIENIINRKNDNKEKFFLPYVIDFASGSGHFVTEIMDEINSYIQKIHEETNFIKGGKSAKDEFNSYYDNYKWAKEYIYGIEKDYRLAKTTKISTFLNGDGEANIVMGDGLDNFEKSKTYVKKLKEIDIEKSGVFDVVVANPPYSIDEFRNTLNSGKETFSLYPYITEKSGNIECLFLERTKQLLNDNGSAGIILPVSFLTSTDNINVKARDLLLKNFNIKSCVYLGEKTFMATNVYAVVLFLQKRMSHDIETIEGIIDNFFTEFKDFTCNGIENAFTKYVEYVYKNLTLDEYEEFIKNGDTTKNTKIKNNQICSEYFEEKLTVQSIIELEKTKLFHFVISYNQKVVVIDSGEGNKELDFLGYEFSTRRGKEGIKLKKTESGDFKSKLFNDKNTFDSSKVNSYILNSFNNSLPDTIDKDVKDYLEIISLCELFDFNNYVFDNRIRYGLQNTRFNDTKTIKLKNLFEPINGVTYNKTQQERVTTSKRILTSTHISLERNGNYSLVKPIYLREDFELPINSQLRKNDLFISTSNSLKHLGKVAYIDKDLDYWGGGFCTILRPNASQFNPKEISLYVQDILQNSTQFRAFINLYKNSRISNIGSDLLNFRIPLPKGNKR